ncbi:hypothetical protein IU433_01340 [Nocardia puris]|uniref:hypothetical protein n=1 Tax=Nocardia puris TaxID=208602 RepID=UPI001894B1F2|nr:hypothetical protein [Nocardia puris]MBF6210429.1 hypothetical protein [Nocardia puris]MBF6367504.1 hypothetical protein [Nocardia puris]MBF6457689.1 hypothetical protein [Nocardia puris]
MTTHLLTRAEITKLARLLEIPDESALDFLSALSPEALRAFRERATDLLFDRDSKRLQRVAAASALVPTAISAKAAERAFGPVLCAAVAGSVEPERAVAIARALPAPFLGAAAAQLDPRRTGPLLAAVPASLAAEVARVLIRAGDHVTLSRFVGAVPEQVLRAALPLAEDTDLLRVGFLLEDKSGTDRLVDLVADRIPGLVRAAADHGLWAEAIDLLDTVSPANRARIGDIAAGLGPEVLDGLLAAVHALDAWATLLPVTAGMSPDGLRALAARPGVHDPAALGAVMDAALDGGLWLELLPLAEHLDDEQRAFLAARLAAKPDGELADLVRRADEAGLWAAMLPIALAMDAGDRARVAALPVLHERPVLRTVLGVIAEHDLWGQGFALVGALPEAAQRILASCLGELTRGQLLAAIRAAAASEHIDTLVAVALAQDADGRARVLDILDGLDDLDEFLAALTADTAPVVWDALVEVREEIPPVLRARLADRADACGHPETAAGLRPADAVGAA